MRSTVPVVLAGTLAVHILVVMVIDVASVVGKDTRQRPVPHIGLVDVKVAKLTPPEPPKPVSEAPPPPAPPTPIAPTTPPPRARIARATPRAVPEPPTSVPSPDVPTGPAEPGAGDPVVTMPDLGPSAHGAAYAIGKPAPRTGRGGTGGGVGTATAGSGSGSASVPLSIAAIKTPARPKGDFDYVGLGKDYPAEAKRLGIEGNLRARLIVDAAGRVESVRLLGSLGHGLDELALARARKLEFEPARDTDDRPVASMVVWTFTFTLPT